jgi:hypothetical protein
MRSTRRLCRAVTDDTIVASPVDARASSIGTVHVRATQEGSGSTDSGPGRKRLPDVTRKWRRSCSFLECSLKFHFASRTAKDGSRGHHATAHRCGVVPVSW